MWFLDFNCGRIAKVGGYNSLAAVMTFSLAPVSKKRKTPKKSKNKEDKKKFSYDKSIENHGKPFCLGNTIRPSSKPRPTGSSCHFV